MQVLTPRYSKEEFARRGDEIYDRDIKPHVTHEDDGKFVVIDIETGDYEMDCDELANPGWTGLSLFYYFDKDLLAPDNGLDLLKQRSKRMPAVADRILCLTLTNQNAAESILRSVAGVDADAVKVRHIHEQGQKLLKLVREGDRDFIFPSRDSGLAFYLYRPYFVFEGEALKDAVHRELTDCALIGEDVSD